MQRWGKMCLDFSCKPLTTCKSRWVVSQSKLNHATQKWPLVLAICAAVALLVMGARHDSAKVLELEGLIIKDADGKSRLEISTGPDGEVTLSMLDKIGRKRLAFAVSASDGAGIALLAEDGTERLGLALTDEDGGVAGVEIYDKKGTRRLGLVVDADGCPKTALFDDSEKIRLNLEVNKNGLPAVHLVDPKGTSRVELVMRKNGSSSIGVNSPEGEPRIDLSVDDDEDRSVFLGILGTRSVHTMGLVGTNDVSGFVLTDIQGVERITMGAKTSGTASISFRDTNGRGRVHIGVTQPDWAGLYVPDLKGDRSIIADWPDSEPEPRFGTFRLPPFGEQPGNTKD